MAKTVQRSVGLYFSLTKREDSSQNESIGPKSGGIRHKNVTKDGSSAQNVFRYSSDM